MSREEFLAWYEREGAFHLERPRFESQALSTSASSCVAICTVPLARFARASSPAPRGRSNSPVSSSSMLAAAPRALASPNGESAMSPVVAVGGEDGRCVSVDPFFCFRRSISAAPLSFARPLRASDDVALTLCFSAARSPPCGTSPRFEHSANVLRTTNAASNSFRSPTAAESAASTPLTSKPARAQCASSSPSLRRGTNCRSVVHFFCVQYLFFLFAHLFLLFAHNLLQVPITNCPEPCPRPHPTLVAIGVGSTVSLLAIELPSEAAVSSANLRMLPAAIAQHRFTSDVVSASIVALDSTASCVCRWSLLRPSSLFYHSATLTRASLALALALVLAAASWCFSRAELSTSSAFSTSPWRTHPLPSPSTLLRCAT